MPGIDCLAPDLTEKSNGFELDPKLLFIKFSISIIASLTCFLSPGGYLLCFI